MCRVCVTCSKVNVHSVYVKGKKKKAKRNSSKEHAKSVACLHLASFSKTLYPLVIILQQPKGKAGFLESVVGGHC